MKDNTIKFTRVYLNNWYQFEDEIINMGNVNLFTGDNQVGKTTALDAIKYCFNGDTKFNVASDVGERTLVGYTKCLLSNSTQEYKRKEQVVTSQIAMEFFDPEKNSYFVVGACIRTYGEETDTQRYQIPNRKLEDIIFKEKNEHGQYEYLDRHAFETKNGFKCNKTNVGTGYGLNMMGFDIHDDYTPSNPKISSLRRIINSIIAYKPKTRIDDFIRNNVLPENPVDLTKVMKITSMIESIQNEINKIEAHQQSLVNVVELGEEAVRLKALHNINLGTVKRFDMEAAIEYREKAIQHASVATTQAKQEEVRYDDLTRDLSLKKDENLKIQQAIYDKGGTLLTSYEDDFRRMKSNLSDLEKEHKRSLDTCDQVVSLIDTLTNRGKRVTNEHILKNLLDENIDTADKLYAVSEFKKFVLSEKEKAEQERARKHNDLVDLEKVKKKKNEILIGLNRHNLESFIDSDILNLRDAINKEFEKQKVPARAKLLYENIIRITDESWRNALESYLGRTRFNIIVPAKYYDIAFGVFKGIRGNGILIKSSLLDKKDVNATPGSIVDLIEVEDGLTRKFLQYRYGRVMQCDDETIKKSENGLTKTGILSQSLTDRKISLNVRDYCLGNEAYQLNIDFIKKELYDIEAKITALEKEKDDLTHFINQCNVSALSNVSYDIVTKIVKTKSELASLKHRIDDLKASMSKDTEFSTLLLQQAEIAAQIARLEDQKSKSYNLHKEFQNLLIDARSKAKSAVDIASDSIDSYKLFIAGHPELEDKILKAKSAPVEDTIRTNARRAEESEKKFSEAVILHGNAYHEVYGSTLDDDVIAKYKDKANELEIKDIAIKRQNLEDQRKAMNHTFKTEFVTAIANNISECIKILNTLNMKLKTINFASEYKFKSYNTPDSKMDAIIRLGELQKESVNRLFLTEEKTREMEQLEEELENYLREIIEKNDTVEMQRLSDYRQYKIYDLLITNDKYGKEDVSLKKEIQTESGAGTQIPYLVILTASLMTVYDSGLPNCVRLMLIDEPFEKMGEENIKSMMTFLKENFQLIMCAPDTQLHLLSKYCDQINAVHQLPGGRTKIFEERRK